MKRYLIIVSHPKKESLNKEICQRIKEMLKDKRAEVKDIDLYRDNFECKCFLNKEKDLNEKVKHYQELIRWSEEIIFIFPIWWQSYPAILKGFFDLVFTPKFAYRYSELGLPIGLLKGRKVSVVRTFGGPKLYALIKGFGSWKAMKKGTFKFCGLKIRNKFDLYEVNMKSFDKHKLDRFLEKIEKK